MKRLSKKESAALIAAAEAAQVRQLIEKPLPPDPEEQNEMRADSADVALDAFAHETGLDSSGDKDECALSDLLCNLMHWCDRQPLADHFDFDAMLDRARANYAEETGEG